MTQKLTNQLKFLSEADKLKTVYRQTLITDKHREETSAEHSWHFALMAMTLFEYCVLPDVDLDRVIKMALIHDLVELYAGDTPAYSDWVPEDKLTQEKEAADKLFSLLPKPLADEYRALWDEFEEMNTNDAKYAAAVDRLQPHLNNYQTEGHAWTKWDATADKVYKRMAPIKTAMPIVWEYVEYIIKDSCEKGYIIP
ncbi:MAG: HD domain-containing protein [Defluviitaleaceae bacterium]|nr:HD domain-containing protein [Defluviitaleaceae bacterium]